MGDGTENETETVETTEWFGDPKSATQSIHERLDEVFDALADSRRRHALSYLSEKTGDAATLSELVAEVVARESDRERDFEYYESVAIELHHRHLPKLEESGLVEYDERSQTVRYHERPRVQAYLSLATESE